MNKLFLGDCLSILPTLPADSVDLIYLDPPFFTQKTHTLKSRNLTEYQFADTWKSVQAYIHFLRQRLTAMRRVMKQTATLFVHCDRNASHHIRLLLDELFTPERFLSEIIWTYRRWSDVRSSLLPSHQTIFMYSKSADYVFNTLMQPYSPATNLDQILQRRERDENGKTVYTQDEDGQVVLNGPKKGVPLSDTWDIPYLNPKAKERTGYPTQKPILLLERIIALASNPNDIVLDPFCGSGTTLVAAHLQGRQYIGMDVSPDALKLSQQRLENPVRTESLLLKKGRETYENIPDYVQAILEPLPVKLVQRNGGIDAIGDQFWDGRPIVMRVQRRGESLYEAANKLSEAGDKKQAGRKILIRIESNDTLLTLWDLPLPDDVCVCDSLNYQFTQLLSQQLVAE